MARSKHSKSRVRRAVAVGLAALAMLAATSPAAAARYDEDQAMNPIQIIALAATPVGVALRWLIVKPVWWLGQRQPLKTLFEVSD